MYSLCPKLLVEIGFSRYIHFVMHLNIYLCLDHNKRNVSRKAKTTSNLVRREYVCYQVFKTISLQLVLLCQLSIVFILVFKIISAFLAWPTHNYIDGLFDIEK
jgi:hypothetical protein